MYVILFWGVQKVLIYTVLLWTEHPSAEALWDKPDGGADPEGGYSVLRLCDWKAESPLP